MRFPITLALLAALSGCADSHQWSPLHNGSARIAKTDKIYISTPPDGEYGDHVYRGSGRNTSGIISSAVSKRSRWMRVGAVADNFQDALAQAQSMGQDVLIYPTILHWEDRATEWSMIPDKVEIKVDVVQVSSGDVISSGIIKGKSGLSTLGGDHPQDLLPEPVAEFVDSLFL